MHRLCRSQYESREGEWDSAQRKNEVDRLSYRTTLLVCLLLKRSRHLGKGSVVKGHEYDAGSTQ